MRHGPFIRIVLPGIALLASSAVPVPAQTVSLSSGEGQVTIQVGDAAALPADFPEDVFLPSAAQLQRVQQDADGGQRLEFSLAGTADEAVAQYAKAMDAAGWTPARVAPVANARVQAWEKDRHAPAPATAVAARGARRQLTQSLAARNGPMAAATSAGCSMCRWWPPGTTSSLPRGSAAARSLRKGSGR